MKGYTRREGASLVWKYDDETVRIEPYGRDSLRVRITKTGTMPERDWEIEDQFMFGSDLMIAPVLYEGMKERELYLPAGGERYFTVH